MKATKMDAIALDSNKEHGVKPYQFEPLAPENNAQSTESPSPGAAMRAGNTNWCECGFCTIMPTEEESSCCTETPAFWRKVIQHRTNSADNQDVDCITEVAGFEPVCLNPFVLETAYLHFKEEHEVDLEVEQAEKFRYTAYRQLVRWCFGFLGRNIRVPLPSCAVTRIRNEYSNEDSSYKGFQWPSL